jgi:dolichyl-phosphate beta-glucosyltransferase
MNQVSFLFKNQLVIAFFCSLLAITTSIVSDPKSNTQPPVFEVPTFCPVTQPCKVIIVIPAYNEEKRIAKTLLAYFDYFNTCKNITATFLVVCNNCSDTTAAVCQTLQKKHPELEFMDLKPGGKGYAVKQGFLKSLEYLDADYIGFVDADMATNPPYFYELITRMQGHDVAIASRYKQGARVWPNRPFIKKIGGKFYNWVLRQNFHLDILDTQCGAKLFTYKTIQAVAPHMQETGWAFDLELLYLCQLFDKKIIEVPTTWVDVPGSHLTISGCYKEFISAPTRIKKQQQKLAAQLSKQKIEIKNAARKQARLEHKQHRHDPKFMAAK